MVNAAKAEVDRLAVVLARLSAAYGSAESCLEAAQHLVDRARDQLAKAKEQEAKAHALHDDAVQALGLVNARTQLTEPENESGLRKLTTEREIITSRLIAIEGRRARDQAAREEAQRESEKADRLLATRRAEFAREKENYQRAEEAHREAQLVAAGDPSALSRKAANDRAQAILNEHTRIVRSHGVFAPGGGPCEASIEAEKIHTRLSTRQPLDANEVGWGSHAEGTGRNVSPVGFRGPAPEQMQEGAKPYNTNDPLSND